MICKARQRNLCVFSIGEIGLVWPEFYSGKKCAGIEKFDVARCHF